MLDFKKTYRFIMLLSCLLFSIHLKAQKTENDSAKFYFKLGLEQSQNGKYDEGLYSFTKAILFDKNFAEAFYNRGILYFETKKIEQGFSDFTKAIQLQPDNGMFYFQRANKKWLALDRIGACADWKKSKEKKFPLAEEEYMKKCSQFLPK